jgi:hypothetical protein
MERLVKEIRLDQDQDPGNGRVTRDKYWNFERAYFVWTTVCGHNSSKKRKGRPL